MDLSKELKNRRAKRSAWVKFCDGFDLHLEYAEPAELKKMLSAAKKTVYRRGQPQEQYDDDIFAAQIAKKILEWDLTLGTLADLTNIEVTDDEREKTVPCTETNVLTVIDEVYGLADFIQDSVTDAARLKSEQQEKEVKNSKTTPGKS